MHIRVVEPFQNQQFRSMREQELDLLIKFMREAANDGTTVDVSAKVSTLTADMTCT